MEDKHLRLTNFFFEIGTLRKLLRSHRQTLLTDDLSDNIASHTFRVAMIGYFLAQEEGADAGKVVMMCLSHDLEEVRSGDQNWLHKRYVKVFEAEIAKDQLSGLPGSDEILKLKEEYNTRETKEAKIAKDADLIDQLLLLKEYSWNGNREAEKWIRKKITGEDPGGPNDMSTPFTKSVAQKVLEVDPTDWNEGLFVSKGR